MAIDTDARIEVLARSRAVTDDDVGVGPVAVCRAEAAMGGARLAADAAPLITRNAVPPATRPFRRREAPRTSPTKAAAPSR